MKNIILIGMPASGKTVIGGLLSQKTDYIFTDTDRVIEARYGRSLEEIISENGEAGFLAIENKIISEMDVERQILSTGGSTVFGADAMKRLGEIGTVVYLKLPPAELMHRLGDLRTRGVIMNGCDTVAEIFAQRTPLYEKYADIVLDCYGKSAEQIADEIKTLCDI